jgi:uncharacterized repeat protein (TIGR03843 family)
MPVHDSTDPRGAAPDPERACLLESDLVLEGRMPWSSNATFLCELWPAGTRPDSGLVAAEDLPDAAATEGGEPVGRAIYKPHRGERPLWDFPDGLYRREVAAYELAQAIGWDLVPTTVVREGPFGVGSLQRFVHADFDQHHFTLVEDEAHHHQLRRLCAFDIVANSTDRKAGHVLIDPEGHLWGIDNGLCLHTEFKLRTVIWEFAGEAVPGELIDDLCRFIDQPLPPALAQLLDPFERDALVARAQALVHEGSFPDDPTGHRIPWPLV